MKRSVYHEVRGYNSHYIPVNNMVKRHRTSNFKLVRWISASDVGVMSFGRLFV